MAYGFFRFALRGQEHAQIVVRGVYGRVHRQGVPPQGLGAAPDLLLAQGKRGQARQRQAGEQEAGRFHVFIF